MEDENRVREVLKEERSALQNTSTINWMRKRHNKTAINYYLNTPDEYKKHLTIEKIFNKFDDDHSNSLEIGEVKEMFRKNKLQVHDDQIRDLFRIVDKTNSGKLTLDTFKLFSLSEQASLQFSKIMKGIRDSQIKQKNHVSAFERMNTRRVNDSKVLYLPLNFNSLLDHFDFRLERKNLKKTIKSAVQKHQDDIRDSKNLETIDEDFESFHQLFTKTTLDGGFEEGTFFNKLAKLRAGKMQKNMDEIEYQKSRIGAAEIEEVSIKEEDSPIKSEPQVQNFSISRVETGNDKYPSFLQDDFNEIDLNLDNYSGDMGKKDLIEKKRQDIAALIDRAKTAGHQEARLIISKLEKTPGTQLKARRINEITRDIDDFIKITSREEVEEGEDPVTKVLEAGSSLDDVVQNSIELGMSKSMHSQLKSKYSPLPHFPSFHSQYKPLLQNKHQHSINSITNSASLNSKPVQANPFSAKAKFPSHYNSQRVISTNTELNQRILLRNQYSTLSNYERSLYLMKEHITHKPKPKLSKLPSTSMPNSNSNSKANLKSKDLFTKGSKNLPSLTKKRNIRNNTKNSEDNRARAEIYFSDKNSEPLIDRRMINSPNYIQYKINKLRTHNLLHYNNANTIKKYNQLKNSASHTNCKIQPSHSPIPTSAREKSHFISHIHPFTKKPYFANQKSGEHFSASVKEANDFVFNLKRNINRISHKKNSKNARRAFTDRSSPSPPREQDTFHQFRPEKPKHLLL